MSEIYYIDVDSKIDNVECRLTFWKGRLIVKHSILTELHPVFGQMAKTFGAYFSILEVLPK